MKKTQIKGKRCGKRRKSLLCVAGIVLVISSGTFLWMDKSYEYKSIENIKKTNQNTTEVLEVIGSELSSQALQKTVILQKLAVQQVPSPGTSSVTPKQIQSQVSNKQKSNDKFMEQVEQIIFAKINQERAKAGVQGLVYNSTMEKYARIKSKDMGDRGYFSHNDPEGNLITTKMKRDGIGYNSWGENIAYIGGVSDANALASQFMTNWMNSPGHKANILSNKFKGVGVGVYKINNKVYATQEFIR